MQSEIKIRGWMNKEFSLPNAGYDTFTISELMSGRYDFHKYERWELSTGFKDKNGVEIYGGDILKVDMQSPLINGENVIVRFSDGMFEISVGRENIPGLPLYLVLEAIREVIGNIHQNPELLK